MIFRDRSKLSPRYIPDKLSHREAALSELESLFGGALDAPEIDWLVR